MPTLLQITVALNKGSHGKIAEQIGGLMKERGWEVYIAHGARYVNASQHKSIQIQSKLGEYRHKIKSLLLDADGLGSNKATQRLIETIKQIKPDIIQIHNIHGYYLNFKLLFEYLNTTSIPIVMTLHDCWVFTGHCVHFVTANCNKWQTGCGNCPQIHSTPMSLFYDNSGHNFDLKNQYINANPNLHIVCVSQWIENYLRQSIYKDHNIYQIHNGIDLDVFKPRKEKCQGIFRIIGVSCPWNKSKGLMDVYKLRELLPKDKFEIVLVGLNEKQKSKLPDGIIGILKTNNQEELAELYSESNVFINPTYADTFPTTNLEALACGTPVITYNTGGSPEAIDSATGIVVETGNVQAMANAIFKLSENQLSSKDCRNRAELLFNKNNCFLRYVQIYKELTQMDINV